MGMSRIVLHIDRLVLRGIGDGDARAFAAGLERELRRQLASQGGTSLAAGGDRDRVRVPRLTVPSRQPPASMGRAVAGAVLRGGRR